MIQRGTVKSITVDGEKKFGLLTTSQGDLYFDPKGCRQVCIGDQEPYLSRSWPQQRPLLRKGDAIVFIRHTHDGREFAIWAPEEEWNKVENQLREQLEEAKKMLVATFSPQTSTGREPRAKRPSKGNANLRLISA